MSAPAVAAKPAPPTPEQPKPKREPAGEPTAPAPRPDRDRKGPRRADRIASPFMTTAEVASYARCCVKTVERAWALYRRTGTSGLRATQRGGAYSTLLFALADVDRWVEGAAPVAANKARLRRAS